MSDFILISLQKMGMTEDDKRNCCLVEIQETEAKYYKTLEDIEKVCVRVTHRFCVFFFYFFLPQCVSIVGVLGPWAVSQHGNVTYWQVHLGAQMSQELINTVIIGSVPNGDSALSFKYT